GTMEVDKRQAQPEARLGIRRRERDRLAVVLERVFGAPPPGQRPRQAVVGVPISRRQRDRTLKALERFVPAIEVAVDGAEPEMRVDETGVERERRLARVGRGRVARG